jgi:hypothetical protein
MRTFSLAVLLLASAAPGARAAAVDGASCAGSRDWALKKSGLRPFPRQLDEASRQVSRIQDQLVAANGLQIADLCPAAVLPMKDLVARSVAGTTADGTAFQFILVSSALLRGRTKNDAQLAFVLGHELNHLASGTLAESARLHAELLPGSGRGEPRKLARYRQLEAEADLGGAGYLKIAGYGVDEALGYLQPGELETNALYPFEARLRALRENLQFLDGINPSARPVAALERAELAVKSANLEEY